MNSLFPEGYPKMINYRSKKLPKFPQDDHLGPNLEALGAILARFGKVWGSILKIFGKIWDRFWRLSWSHDGHQHAAKTVPRLVQDMSKTGPSRCPSLWSPRRRAVAAAGVYHERASQFGEDAERGLVTPVRVEGVSRRSCKIMGLARVNGRF